MNVFLSGTSVTPYECLSAIDVKCESTLSKIHGKTIQLSDVSEVTIEARYIAVTIV
jgi:hypothetical protein